MLFLNNKISSPKGLGFKAKINDQSNPQSEKTLIDFTNPANIETANRLRIQFAGIIDKAQDDVIDKAIKKEFGNKDLPQLRSRVREKLFANSGRSKTIGIG